MEAPKLFNDNFQNFKKYNIPKAQEQMLKVRDEEQITLFGSAGR